MDDFSLWVTSRFEDYATFVRLDSMEPKENLKRLYSEHSIDIEQFRDFLKVQQAVYEKVFVEGNPTILTNLMVVHLRQTLDVNKPGSSRINLDALLPPDFARTRRGNEEERKDDGSKPPLEIPSSLPKNSALMMPQIQIPPF